MARTPPARARRRSLRATARAASVTAAATTAVATAAFAPAAAAAAPPAAVPGHVPAAVRAPDPGGGLIEVTPRRVEAGTEIRVRVDFCVTERTAMATSVAFEADVDLKRTPDGAAFHGSAQISVTADPGTYGITVVCGVDARQGQGSFKVVAPGGGRGDHHGGRPDGHDGGHHGDDGGHHEPPRHHASPVAPVRAGGGGTAGDHGGDGDTAAQRIGLTMAGGAAVAGAALWAVRRRRAGARTGG